MRRKSILTAVCGQNWVLLMLYAAFSILSGAVLSVSTNVRANFINFLTDNNREMIRISLTQTLFTIFLYYYLIPFVLSFVGAKAQKRIALSVDRAVQQKKAAVPYRYLEGQEVNDKIKRLEDVSEQVWNLIKGSVNLFGCAVESLCLFAIITKLGAINSILIILLFLPLLYYSVRSGRMYYDTWSRTAKLRRHNEYIRDILLDKKYAQDRILFQYFPYFQKIWKEEYKTIRSVSIKEELRGAKKIQICGTAFCVYIAVLLYILAVELGNGRISLGFAVSIISILPVFLHNLIVRASHEINDMVKAKESVNELEDFLKLEELEVRRGTTIGDFKRIEIKNVWFRYPNSEEWALKDLNMTIEKNKHYSIVGRNGAGKSTLLHLLLGLYQPERGEILIDGKNLKEFSETEIRGFFSAMTQEPQRYETVISENIGIGDLDRIHDEEAIASAAKSINIDDFINGLPGKYHTALGTMFSGGVELSGGEWKKLCLSRMILSKALVKILDEPTAAMDPKFEKWISDYFDQIMKDQTCILVSHRMASSKNVDQILVFDRGEIRERGSHEQLMKQKGMYYEMYTTQEAMYEDAPAGSAI